MSYHIYNTEGVILSSHLAGDSSRFYNIYTKKLGLVGVWAQGVRKLESKLRFNLQDFSHVRIHLVRGKHMWRLIDIETQKKPYNILSLQQKRLVLGRMTSLLRRLLDEGSDDVLYDLFLSAVAHLDDKSFDMRYLNSFELLFVLRVLHHLGYGKDSIKEDVILSYLWNEDVLEYVQERRLYLTKVANISLQHTHM